MRPPVLQLTQSPHLTPTPNPTNTTPNHQTGEKAPNYVSYTMINLPLAAETVQPCNPIPNNEWTQTGLPEANWLELHGVPKTFAPVRGYVYIRFWVVAWVLGWDSLVCAGVLVCRRADDPGHDRPAA